MRAIYCTQCDRQIASWDATTADLRICACAGISAEELLAVVQQLRSQEHPIMGLIQVGYAGRILSMQGSN